jgi:tetratricopeptide (TPR) repeat protein
MLGFIDQSQLGRKAKKLAITSLVVVTLGAQPSIPQSSDTAQAKLHYQNAVVAIGKGDWQSAQNEMLLAEKLAPQNALVHYDLALAYSHMGQIQSAETELTKAIQLGLPAQQRHAAAELKQRLALSPHTHASVAKASPLRRTSQDSPIHALNALIKDELGVTRGNYRPYEFTFEISTGKLWWSRLTDSYCKSNVAFSQGGARLSELDADSISSGTNDEGVPELVLNCKNGAACFEDWASPTCTGMDNFNHSGDDTVEVLDKSFTDAGVRTQMRFMGRLKGLEILTTGDPDESKKAIDLLRQLIGLAPPPSEAFLASAARQKTDEQAEEKAATEKKQEEDRASAEKVQTDLSQLQGTWHATLGHSITAAGTAHGAVYGGPFQGTVNVHVDRDYFLTMNAPDNNSATGTYFDGNEKWQLEQSSIVTAFINDCFDAAGGCYTSYSWNKTAVYSATASEDDDGTINVELVHQECRGACSESDRHLRDLSGTIGFVSPYIIRLKIGNDTYVLKKL